ncbi:MAG: class II glutamine amidotransferase, partial [Planctomycetota bacterium]
TYDSACEAETHAWIAHVRLATVGSVQPENTHPFLRERWCFATPGEGDLVTARGKLLGSAQRRLALPPPRLLHHGSLVLTQPALTPFVAAVAVAAPPVAALRARRGDALVAGMAAALGMTPHDGELDAAERDLAARLARERYGDPAFTCAR